VGTRSLGAVGRDESGVLSAGANPRGKSGYASADSGGGASTRLEQSLRGDARARTRSRNPRQPGGGATGGAPIIVGGRLISTGGSSGSSASDIQSVPAKRGPREQLLDIRTAVSTNIWAHEGATVLKVP